MPWPLPKDEIRVTVGLDMLGYVAGLLSCIAFLPQVVHTWRSRSVKDISLGMFLLNCLGAGLWLWYGFRVKSLPIIATNGAILLLSMSMLVMKIRFTRLQAQG
ncbi:MAG: SemiSWEET transporter [Magnetococcales bacterium]|nr:SemiSWEET transporter [Magnetococcales bacterium]